VIMGASRAKRGMLDAPALLRAASPAHGLGVVYRFAAAGVINTLLSAAIILGLDLGLGVLPALANTIGYGAGVAVSWSLQRRFVFRAPQSRWRDKAKFLAVIGVSFLINQLTLLAAHAVLGSSMIARGAAQLCAMATYTTVQFVLLRFWVFPAARSAAADGQEIPGAERPG
jgi:putative flippase GtrA